MSEFNKQTIVGKKFTRSAAVEIRELNVDDEARTAELAFSSDAPIQHWFGYLVLDHSAESVRLDRLKTAGAVLWNHDRDIQIGVPESVGISDDNKCRATVKFSDSICGDENFRDVKNGIKRNVSFGFFLYDVEPEVGNDGKQKLLDGEPVYRSRDWEPFEISLVSIPADTSVGVGRELYYGSEDKVCADCGSECCDVCGGCPDCETCTCAMDNKNRALKISKKTAPQAMRVNQTTKTENEMPKENENGENTEQRQQPAKVAAQSTDVTRIAEFIAIGESFGEVELARELALAEGKTTSDLKRAILEKRAAGQANVPAKPIVDLSKREREQYSIARAILADANIRDGKSESCFELEVSDAARKSAVRNIPNYENKGGVIIPTGIALRGARQALLAQMRGLDRQFNAFNQMALLGALQRAGLDTLTDTAGQELVFTEEGAFIDLLRNRAMVMQLGATVLPGLSGNVAFPKQIGAGTFTWMGENSGSDVADSNLTLDQVTLTPKTGQSTTAYSRQLLAQSNVNVDGLVQSDLVQITSLAIDRAAIHGLGSSNQPRGVYQTSGVNAVAFGGPITLDKVVDMETEIATDNADIGTMAYLTTPGARGKAKKTQEFSSTNGMPLWRDGEVNGYRAEASNQVSSVMNSSAVSGGSSHGIVFGVWSQLLFGEWGAMEIITDPYRLKKQGMIEVTNFVMIDIALRYPESFCKGTGQSLS